MRTKTAEELLQLLKAWEDVCEVLGVSSDSNVEDVIAAAKNLGRVINLKSWEIGYDHAREDMRDLLGENRQKRVESCQLCTIGFPVEEGMHLPTQKLGMIPPTPCRVLGKKT